MRRAAHTRGAPISQWLQSLATLLSTAAIDFTLSDKIEQAMRDKIVFLSSLAGANCTLRASIDDILNSVAGEDFINGLLADCARVAQASGHTLAEAQLAGYRKLLTQKEISGKRQPNTVLRAI